MLARWLGLGRYGLNALLIEVFSRLAFFIICVKYSVTDHFSCRRDGKYGGRLAG